MKIYYCDHCQKRVPEEELESGSALIESDDKAFCAACVAALNKQRPLKRPTTRGNALPGRAARATPSVLVHPHALNSHTPLPPAPHASGLHRTPASMREDQKARNIPYYALGGVVVVALVLIIYVAKFSGAQARPAGHNALPPPPPIPVAAKDPTPVVAPERSTGLFGEMTAQHPRETSTQPRKDPPVVAVSDPKVAPLLDWSKSQDLLALADPRNALDSEWKRPDTGGVRSDRGSSPTNASRLEIPFHPPAEYTIRASFDRRHGNGDVAFVLPHPAGSTQFFWVIGAQENKTVALGEVRGKRFDGNPASADVGKVLENRRRYTTIVEVRKDRIRAYLEGKLAAEWTSSMGPIKIHDAWKLKDSFNLAIGSWQSEVIFHSLDLLEQK